LLAAGPVTTTTEAGDVDGSPLASMVIMK
jgi:hypothetical protein